MSFKYFRPGASGTGSGNDWTNAYTTLTALKNGLARGDTGYLGVGTTTEDVLLNTAASGTQTITLKKATIADHGTETGWNNTYAGQTVLIGSLQVATNYWVVDGVYRAEENWRDSGSYGIRIKGTVYSWPINFPPGGNHLVFRYLDVGADVGSVYPSISGPPFYFVSDITQTDFTISYCHAHNCGVLYLVGVDGVVIEKTAFTDQWGKEMIRGFGTCTNGILRYLSFHNTTRDTGGPGEAGTAPIAIWDSNNAGAFDNWQIYGIEMLDTEAIEHSGGAIVVGGDGGGWVGVPANNVKIYNITVAGFQSNISANILINGGTGNEIRNVLWYDCIGSPNASPNTSSNAEESSSPFASYPDGDLRLAIQVPGTSLDSPFNVDIAGNLRGQDGSFDRGAYEYIPDAPVGADVLVLNQTANVSPVTELWKRAPVVDGVAGAFEFYLIHHSGPYPSQPLNNFVYAYFGGLFRNVYVFEGTITVEEAIAYVP